MACPVVSTALSLTLTSTLLYFSLDRTFNWDSDSTHLADYTAWHYFNVIFLPVYVLCFSVGGVILTLRMWLWFRPAPWLSVKVNECDIVNSAIAVAISVISMLQLSLDLWWGLFGVYPYVAPMLVLTVCVVVLHRASMRAQQ